MTERLRDHRIGTRIGSLLRDIRYALRALRRAPVFVIVAVLTLGLAIGANTAVFSLVDGVLLSELPYDDPEQLVTLWSTTPSRGVDTRSPVSYPDFLDWRSQARSFQSMAMLYGHGTVLDEPEGPTSILVAAVSGDYFDVLRAHTVLGSAFSQAEVAENAQVAVLKYGTWQRRYGGDPEIIGRSIVLGGLAYTVVGVTERGSGFPMWGELWIPLTPELVHSQNLDNRGQRIDTWVLARLRPGIEMAEARSEMQTVTQRLTLEYLETNTDWSALVVPLRQIVIDPFGQNAGVPRSLFLLNGAVALVLLIACANLANLQLARVLHRGRELGIRSALGAGRWRLMRHLLTESLLLSVAGSLLGVGVARWAVSFVLARGPALPRSSEIAIDLRVLGFTAALVALAALLSGIVPALRGTGARLMDLQSGAQRSIGSRRGTSLSSALVATQVGLALLLLVGAGLLIETLRNLQRVDPGFDPKHLLAVRVEAPTLRYATDEQLVDLQLRLEQEIEAIPGIVGAASVNHIPGGGMVISPLETPALDTTISVAFRTASPDYLETMGIPVLEGRGFTRTDGAPWSGAILVNERLAAVLAQSIGARITVFRQKPAPNFGEPLEGEVVGVVGNVRGSLAEQVPLFTVYVPHTLNPWQSPTLVVRTDSVVQNVAALVRETVARVDPTLPITWLYAMDNQLRISLSQQRFTVFLMSAFAAAALLLAALGIYGVLAYLVRQRTREIGVRLALGARPVDVVHLVVRHAIIIVAVGGLMGLAAALALTRVMSSLLFGVSANDPATLIGVIGVLVAVAFVASYLPARRAASLDPIEVLRME